MYILERFSKYLTAIEYPKEKTSWNIAGIIKGQNAFYKFDVRDMFSLSNGDLAQKGSTNTKADKMVLEIKDEWVILDLKELHNYIKKNKLKQVYLNDILPKLDWTIKLLK
jgi:tRNA A58 N-methylase Trm61